MTMDIGIIGLGSVGERHFRNISARYPSSRISILTERTDFRAPKNTELFSSKKDFFAQPIDVFFIANETGKHAETILACLKKKPKGLFVEKPVSHDLVSIPAIRRELKRLKTVFFVGYCLQFSRPLLRMKEIIRKGELGGILYVRSSFGQDLRTWRKRDFRKSYSFASKKGGGVVLDIIHEINYPAWLLGEPIDFVAGVTARAPHIGAVSEDLSEAIFRSDSGTVVSVHQDRLRLPGLRTCEVIGTKGTLAWDERAQAVEVATARRVRRIDVSAATNDKFVDELEFFMNNVTARKRYSNLEEAVRDLRNALALKKHAIKR